MKKKLVFVIGLCMGMAVPGCGLDADTAVETNETQVIETETVTEPEQIAEPEQTEKEEEPEERKPDYLFCELPFDGGECIVPDTIIHPENYTYVDESLRITEEQKDAFIAEYGEEAYENAASALVQVLHIQKRTPIYASYTTELKETYGVEDVVLTSELDGHHITADHIYQNGSKDNDTVIMVHGIGGTRRSMKEDIDFYLGLGYNVLTYDQRSSGENDGFFYTLGVWEQYDLMDCVNYIDEQISEDKKIIVLGQSSGGTSAGLILGNEEAQEKVDYVILDSPVTSIYDLIKPKLARYVKADEVDDAMLCCEVFMKFMYGFGFEDGEVANFVADTTIPVLILTSQADTIVPMEQSQRLYDAIESSHKKIVISKISTHVSMKSTEHELYEKEVRNFLGL